MQKVLGRKNIVFLMLMFLFIASFILILKALSYPYFLLNDAKHLQKTSSNYDPIAISIELNHLLTRQKNIHEELITVDLAYLHRLLDLEPYQSVHQELIRTSNRSTNKEQYSIVGNLSRSLEEIITCHIDEINKNNVRLFIKLKILMTMFYALHEYHELIKNANSEYQFPGTVLQPGMQFVSDFHGGSLVQLPKISVDVPRSQINQFNQILMQDLDDMSDFIKARLKLHQIRKRIAEYNQLIPGFVPERWNPFSHDVYYSRKYEVMTW